MKRVQSFRDPAVIRDYAAEQPKPSQEPGYSALPEAVKDRQDPLRAELPLLQARRAQAAVDLDTDAVNAWDRRIHDIRARLGEQTLKDRVDDTLTASLSGYAGDMTNAAGTVAGLFSGQGPASRSLYDFADKMYLDSRRADTAAKDGLGPVRRFAVDLGNDWVRQGVDGLANGLIGGAGLVAKGVRSFGSGAHDARAEGGSEAAQLINGAEKAALEVVTQHIANIPDEAKREFVMAWSKKYFPQTFQRFVSTPQGMTAVLGGAEAIGGAIANGVDRIVETLTYDRGSKWAWKEVGDIFYNTLMDNVMGHLPGNKWAYSTKKAGTGGAP